jgi:peptide/nickel transport system substrate-binding protein
MRLSGLLLLAASSVGLLTSAAAATRPQYGGTLHCNMPYAVGSLDPAGEAGPASADLANLTALLYDPLVAEDEYGRIQPALAASWQAEPGNRRWQFRLRAGVLFHDGSPLTADAVAASLRVANPSWKVIPSVDSVVIELSSPDPDLLAELAESRNAIAKRNGGGNAIGTGPFKVASWDPGKKLTANANEEYWNGRPFLDSIQVDLGVSSRDQLEALELGKTEVAELLPEQARRAALEGYRTVNSAPVELVALLFNHEAQSPGENALHEALSLSIDRATMRDVLLQGFGEPAGSLLPNWLTGYGFVFNPTFDLAAAREKRAASLAPARWTVSYDPADPTAHVIAERVALNAQDAGILLHVSTAPGSELRLVRLPVSSADPGVALSDLERSLGLASSSGSIQSVDDRFRAESEILGSHRVIPLLFLSRAYALSSAVRGFSASHLGMWRPADVWLARRGK